MNAPARRWFREPMVWLLVALPLLSMVATVALVRIAGGGASLDVAPEPVQRSAQVQQRDLGPDHRAAELGLAATARVRAAGAGTGALVVDAAALPPGDYALALVHPSRRDADVRIARRHDGGAELAFAGVDPAVAWRVRLGPASAEWRLVGRFDPARPDAAIALRPALGGDGDAPR